MQNNFIIEMKPYRQILAWNKKYNSHLKARFVWCNVKEKYFCLIGDSINQLCKGCQVVKQNF